MTLAGSRLFSGVFSRLSGRGAQPGSAVPTSDFALVRHSTHLQDLARVERHLPEILGRALARAWIDGDFSDALRADPKGLLARYQVYLPTTVAIEIETTETQRQRIVVYENRQQGDRRRVMYLQLVMLAGK